MGTEVVAVVRGEDEIGIVQFSGITQGSHDVRHHVVERVQRAHPVLVVPVVGGQHLSGPLGRAGREPPRLVRDIGLEEVGAVRSGGAGKRVVSVPGRWWQGQVRGGGRRVPEERRAVSGGPPDEVRGLGGDNIGRVVGRIVRTAVLHHRAVLVQRVVVAGVEIVVDTAVPLRPARRNVLRFVLDSVHVLSGETGAVPGVMQVFGEGLLLVSVRRERGPATDVTGVGEHSGVVAVLSGQDRAAGRAADGRRSEAVGERQPTVPDEGGRVRHSLPVRRGGRVQVVGKDEHEVRPAVALRHVHRSQRRGTRRGWPGSHHGNNHGCHCDDAEYAGDAEPRPPSEISMSCGHHMPPSPSSERSRKRRDVRSCTPPAARIPNHSAEERSRS